MERNPKDELYTETTQDTAEAGPHARAEQRQEIAARIRALLDGRGLDDAARRLGVSVEALTEATDPAIPVHPVAVLAVIAYELGVDPTWLLTGQYDARTHRAASVSVECAAKEIRSVIRLGTTSW